MVQADAGSKWIIGESPEAWARWVLNEPDVTVEEQLSTEFQLVRRLTDSLLRVKDRYGEFLLLTELQLHTDKNMPGRMRAYIALAEEKYRLPVYPVVFYLLPPAGKKNLPSKYASEFRGIRAYQDFKVVKAWELDARQILTQKNMALLPFIPLMQGADKSIIRQGAQMLRQHTASEELETVLAFFAGFVMDERTVKQMLQWDMPVIRESPMYKAILKEGWEEGVEKGRQEGLQQGLQKGKIEGQREDILNVLRIRFEPDDKDKHNIADHLKTLASTEVMEDLLTAAVTANSLTDFYQTLERYTGDKKPL